MTDKVPQLGRLERVDLRKVWESEPYNFTPWLAEEDNLNALAAALDLPTLELVQTEAQVSEFSVDIVAKLSGTDEIVVIENQLERTDHSHLGQALTYAAGTDASLIVWVAKTFAEGHREAIDWLNRTTNEDMGFFGVEIEAWRIGDSAPAPKFNVVARPNNWAKAVREVANAPSPSALQNIAFWEAFNRCAEERGLIEGARKPGRGNNLYLGLAKNGDKTVWNSAFITRSKTPSVGAYLFIQAEEEPELDSWLEKIERLRTKLETLLASKFEIVRRSETLAWLLISKPLDPDDKSQWNETHPWLVQTMLNLANAYEKEIGPAINLT